jgi:transposase
MEWKLTAKERKDLVQRHRQERDRRICDRIKAVLACDDGYSYSEITKILLLDDETIRRHIDDYQREHKLSTNNGGSDSKLLEPETRSLIEYLSEVIYLYVKDICQHVKQKYKKKYSISGMTKWLHANGFSYKKTACSTSKSRSRTTKEIHQIL